MSTSLDMAPGSGDGDDLLAAEYVLGTLPLADRLTVERRLRDDAALQPLVDRWEAHFAPLNDNYPELPAPDLLPRIEARLFPVATPARKGWTLWQGLLGGLVAAGLALAVFQYASRPVLVVPEMVATLAADGQPLVFAASYDVQTRALTVTRTAGGAAAADQDYELWVIGASGVPVSLGVMPTEAVTIPLADLQPAFVLAVSLEAKGGSVTGAPATVLVTGPVTEL